MPINNNGSSLYATAIRGERPVTILGEPSSVINEANQQFQADQAEFKNRNLIFVEIKSGEEYQKAGMERSSLH